MALTSQLSLYCYAVAPTSATAVVEYARQIEALSFSSVAPGGCGDLQATLRVADARLPRPELALFAKVAVMAGPDCLWLGEITDSAQTLDSAGEYFAIAALGIGNCLRDDPTSLAYTNQTVKQISTAQYNQRAAFIGLDSDLSQVFPDNPAGQFSPAYVNRSFEEVMGDLCVLAGDYQWGVWPYAGAQPGAHRDAWGFPAGQIVAHVRDTATTHYLATYANRDIAQHTITPSAERAYNAIVIGYADSNGPGTVTTRDSRLNNDGSQGTAPFRRRQFVRDLSGISTITQSQAQSIANQYLSLYQNITNKVGLTLHTVNDVNGTPIPLWRVQADKNIFVPELAPRGTQLATTATAGINQFYIVKATYAETSGGDQTLALECDNFLDAAEIQIARLQIAADAAARNKTTTVIVQAPGAPEKGYGGFYQPNAAAGATIKTAVKFTAVMSHTPSSVTLATSSSANASGVTWSSISRWGFTLQWTATVAGDSSWFGFYQTVGNCLLAVDAAAGTYDRHCDTCGQTFTGLDLAAMQVTAAEAGSGISRLAAVCACGAVEAFNTDLTVADAAGGDFRNGQARLIRAALAALGMPLA